MTLFEKWHFIMRDCVAPNNYIDWSYYALIAASLQRRLWSGPEHQKLFGNIYTILVGEPGVGKGVVIKPVKEFLSFHKMTNPAEFNNQKFTPETPTDISAAEKVAATSLQEEDFKSAEKMEDSLHKKTGKKYFDKPLRTPLAADAVTYEALVEEIADSIRRTNYPKFSPELNKNVLGIYLHSSLCFALEEISSLFRKRTEDLVHFLIQAYDCGDYVYKTKTQGKDRIKSCCLNFFGGTTPGFLQSVFDDALLTEGFASRTFFIYANANRFRKMRFDEHTTEQLQAKKDLLDHIDKLTKLYGKVEYEDGVWDYLDKWWIDHEFERPNTHPKLNPYYARKNIHIQKLAMAIHFGESTEMKISMETILKAEKILAQEEKSMHFCLGFEKANPLANCTVKIKQFFKQHKNRQFTQKELINEFFDVLPGPDYKESLKQVIEHLLENKIIRNFSAENPLTKTLNVVYKWYE